NASAGYLQPHVSVIDKVGYLSYGPDTANVLFHVVNECHLRRLPILFATNKSPLTNCGDVLHDHDLAELIVDRALEKGRSIVVDGPLYRTRHLHLDNTSEARKDAVRIYGKRTHNFWNLLGRWVAQSVPLHRRLKSPLTAEA
ncbi:MAG: ATP-binding protein, partial [Spirochaetia bacterium]